VQRGGEVRKLKITAVAVEIEWKYWDLFALANHRHSRADIVYIITQGITRVCYWLLATAKRRGVAKLRG